MKEFEFFLLLLTLLCFESKAQILRILDDKNSDLIDTDRLTQTDKELDTNNISSDLIKTSDSIDPSSNLIFTTSDSSESSLYDITLERKLETDNLSDSPRLILLGFYHPFESLSQMIKFQVIFFRIQGGMPSKNLTFTISINYERRLRLLEEVKVNCTRITDDSNYNIEYNCTAPINVNNDSYSISTQGNDLRFGNGESTYVKFSSIANQTKNNINRQRSSEIKKTIVLNGTVLDQDSKTFNLTGNFTEDINDDTVLLYFNETIQYVRCPVKKTENKLYKLECTTNKSIKANLEGIMGRTLTAKYILINFADENNDLLEIEGNNNNDDNNNTNNNNNNDNDNNFNNVINERKSSSSKISKGALIGIIIAAVVVLIIIGVVIAILCRKSTKPIVQETIMEINPNQSVKQLECKK